jgi:dTDP-4-amino-4,6-dideoxygalactose transaminase
VDIDLDTLNIDPHKVEKRISSDVVAIQVINHGGVRVDSALINKIAQKKKN